MGCVDSKSADMKEQLQRNKLVDRELKDKKKEIMSEIKLLLLGTGESGKSTIAKQLKILHADGFTNQELLSYKPVVVNNTIGCIKVLVTYAAKFNFELQEKNKVYAGELDQMNAVDVDQITSEIALAIQELWADKAIKDTFERRTEFQLMDSAEYCFHHVERFCDPEYVPTQEDILRVRARTTGIIETTFKIRDTSFRLVDVGGQRSERKKWIHCFEDVTAIIYCVALNEYDMKLFEDEKVNRMKESIELFEEICNSKWFSKTAIILFLNKKDLFEVKIKQVDLKVLFPDYTGGSNYDHAVVYIRDMFFSLNKMQGKKLFSHVTQATSTESVKVVFDSAKEIIISQNLERLGFGPL